MCFDKYFLANFFNCRTVSLSRSLEDTDSRESYEDLDEEDLDDDLDDDLDEDADLISDSVSDPDDEDLPDRCAINDG